MKHYRETIIKQIVQSPDTLSVEPLIDNRIRMLIENGTHLSFVLDIIDKLKTALNEIKKAEASQKEWDNITQAWNVLNDYDMKKLTETRTESK